MQSGSLKPDTEFADGVAMHVDRPGTVSTARRNRRAAAPFPAAPAAAAPGHVLAPAAAPALPNTNLGAISTAAGPWRTDWARAQADAQLVLDSIDFSKHDIVIWVPGSTGGRGSAKTGMTFGEAVRDSYRGEGSSLTTLRYEASWDLRRSVPTGIATLRIVLAEIAKRGGQHRVLLAGEDQGAWVIGEAIADQSIGHIVDRVLLAGHPVLAAHKYTDGHDPRVRVVNRDGDALTQPTGDPTALLDALIDLHGGDPDGDPNVLTTLLRDPEHVLEAARDAALRIPYVRDYLRDPTDYSDEMTRAVEYLRTGQ